MAAFEYAALDTQGRRKRGILEGDTARQVRQQLRDQGWTPLDVEPVAERTAGSRGTGLTRRRLSPLELAIVTRQTATLLRAGLPLEQVLSDVARQSGKPRIERIVLAVRSRVREGHSLSTALADFPGVFPEMYRKTVGAGEQSGHLEEVLDRLAEYTENQQQMRQKTMLALFYPALLTVLSLAIVAGLLTYVVPQIVHVFDNMHQQLPWITRALIATSDAARAYGLYVLILLIAAGVATVQLLKRPGPRRRWHRFILRLPLAGRMTRAVNAARFARTLGILTASSVSILDALRASAQVLGNLPMRDAVEDAAAKVREGTSLRTALDRTGYFPPMTLSLIASGESSGNLEGMLERAANMQDREVETTVAALMGLLEPLLILLMGGIVLIIVLAILLPIFDLNQLVS